MIHVYVSRSLAAGKRMPITHPPLAIGKRARNVNKRPALTLFEVVLAMAIFLIGITALYQLIQTGSYRAIYVERKAEASTRCQSKLAEVVSGVEALESNDFQAFADDAKWQWRVQAEEQYTGLYHVSVLVRYEVEGGETIQASLSQFVIPPSQRGSTQDAAPQASSSASQSAAQPEMEEGE